MFILSTTIATILLLWFRTEVFIEYCRLFHLNTISYYKNYDVQKKNDVSLNYIGYLRQYHNCFFVRLITCPICLAVWLTFPLTLIFSSMIFSPMIFVAGIILFGIINNLLG